MIDAPIKRSFLCNGYLRLADSTRQPVRIIEQGPDYFWVTAWKPTRLPGAMLRAEWLPGVRVCRSDSVAVGKVETSEDVNTRHGPRSPRLMLFPVELTHDSGLPRHCSPRRYIGAGMCQRRTFGLLRRAQGRAPKGSGASSRQPAVLPTYGIGGMYGLGFRSSPHRGKHQQTSPAFFRLTRSQFGC